MAEVAKQYVGKTFRVLGKGLRFERGPGMPHKEVFRPRRNDPRTGYVFTDSDEDPTLVKFEEGDQVDVDALIQIGGIIPWTKSAQAAVARTETAKPPAPGEGA